jgi:DNA-binding response OmpR family regulator
MRPRVLVITEQTVLRATIARALLAAGYGVEVVSTEKLPRQLMGKERFEAAIVAPSSPSPDYSFLHEVRDNVSKLIILPADQGAGEQLAAAFPESLVCPSASLAVDKLVAILGNPAPREPRQSLGAPFVYFEGCTLDIDGHTFLNADHREFALTAAEFALLVTFVRNPGRVLSRAQLHNAIAPPKIDVFDRSVDMLVARLRRKIEPNPTLPRNRYHFRD